jgi:hypothetical protein
VWQISHAQTLHQKRAANKNANFRGNRYDVG